MMREREQPGEGARTERVDDRALGVAMVFLQLVKPFQTLARRSFERPQRRQPIIGVGFPLQPERLGAAGEAGEGARGEAAIAQRERQAEPGQDAAIRQRVLAVSAAKVYGNLIYPLNINQLY